MTGGDPQLIHPALPPARVTVADDALVRVQAYEPGWPSRLDHDGFFDEGGGHYSTRVNDDHEKAALFTLLRDAGVCFERGREWSPAEVFEYLRDEGLVAGPFRSLAWRGPSDWIIRDE